MIVEVRSRNLELTPAAEAHFQDQFSKVLSSFGHRVRGVTVRLDDINGPRGGVDKLCRVTVHFTRGGTLVAEGRGENIGQAAAFAATRTRARVRRWAQMHERGAERRAAS